MKILGNKSLTLPNESNPTEIGLKVSPVECCEAHRKLEAMYRGYPIPSLD